jgi:DNA-binding transcriptional MerR regulator
MWLAELSERSGVPIPTIKYYRRESLLPPGEAAGATRARYGERHLERLRLIRALVTVAGMPIAQVREVLAVVADPETPVARAMGNAHERLSPVPAIEPSSESMSRVGDLIRRRRWRTAPAGRHARALAAALDTMTEAGLLLSEETLAAYAEGAVTVARADLAGMAHLSREGAVERAVTGTVLGEPVLLALRRMAQESAARRRGRA